MTELGHRPSFDLPDALPSQVEALAHLFEGAGLAPVQAVLLPIAERHLAYAEGVAGRLREAGLRVEVDGQDRGTRIIKLESAVSELDQLLKTALDPMDFMCQSLGVAGREHLDLLLTKTMMEKVPRHGLAHLCLVEKKMEGAVMDRGERNIVLDLETGLSPLNRPFVDNIFHSNFSRD